MVHELPRPLFFHPSSYAFCLLLIFYLKLLGALGDESIDVNDITMNSPLRLGSSSPTRGWDNHVFFNDAGAHIRGP